MKKLILGILAFGSLSVQASMMENKGPIDSEFFGAKGNEVKTYFETIGDLFSQGSLPDLSKISDIAWPGRCFFEATPNKPRSSGYILRTKKNSDVGPLSRSLTAYEAYSYWNVGDPSFFDHMSLEQVLAWLGNEQGRETQIDSKQITVKLFGEYNSIRSAYSNVRASGKYLVEEDVETRSNAGSLPKSYVVSRCYYFIPDQSH